MGDIGCVGEANRLINCNIQDCDVVTVPTAATPTVTVTVDPVTVTVDPVDPVDLDFCPAKPCPVGQYCDRTNLLEPECRLSKL